MKLQNKPSVDEIIRTIAREEGVAPEVIRQSMQEALDAAWTAGHARGNLRAQLAWQSLFPGNRKPSLAEFLVRMADEVTR